MTQTPPQDRTINYVEFNVTDIARSKAFYGSAFGWTFTDYGPNYCEFSDGVMKGGFDSMTRYVTSDGGPLIVLYSHDLEELQSAIVAAGGKITKPIFDFPGGKRFHFTDPDKYELAAWTET